MWNAAGIVILAVEIALLLGFVIGKLRKRKLNETAVFIGIVFALDLALHLVPYLYRVVALRDEGNSVLGLMECFSASLKMFLGEASTDSVADFAAEFPVFSFAYFFGLILSVLATISAAVEAFGNNIRNQIRLGRACRQDTCDIVVGNSPKARQYAKTCNAVLLLDDSVSRDTAIELMEEGYTVLRGAFTQQLLSSRRFNAATRYAIICPGEEKALEQIDTFIAWKKDNAGRENFHLYVEVEEDKAQTVRREVIEKNGCELWIDTFCTNELLARTFVEAHPVTKYLPNSFFEGAAVKSDAQIHIFMLGFGELSREVYRQSILNNQLVCFTEGNYRVHPIHYHICDTGVDANSWNVGGLKKALGELDAEKHFPLPELPFETCVMDQSPASREVLKAIKEQVRTENSYSMVIVDTGNECRNMEIGAKLKVLLYGQDRFHLFVRSQAAFAENDAVTTYYGKSESVLSHEVIVSESLSHMAKKLNEVYTAYYAGNERNRPDFAEYVRQKAEKDWQDMDYFTLYSNLYAAMNLRVKLNLLGLDYVKDGKAEGLEQIQTRYSVSGKEDYESYFDCSVRNALIAQEHARWNAYHLLSEYLPLEKDAITVKSDDGKKVRFTVKNPGAKKHACLTTYRGLDALSSNLAQRAGGSCTAADYDYYIYDELLITSATQLLQALGYSVTEK